MNLTNGDKAWYVAVILGTSLSFKILEFAGVEGHWSKLIPAAIIGIGLGWAAQNAVEKRGLDQ